MQVYCYLDIGMVKIMLEEQVGIFYYLIDIKNIDQCFIVVEFVSWMMVLIIDISVWGKLFIIVGGIGFYLQFLLVGYQFGLVDNELDMVYC